MATTLNIFIDQGSTFEVRVPVRDSTGSFRDLTGYTGRAQLRRSYFSSSNTTFTTTVNANGNVYLSLTATQTAALKYGRYVYDVEIVSGNVVERVSEGIASINPEVTK